MNWFWIGEIGVIEDGVRGVAAALEQDHFCPGRAGELLGFGDRVRDVADPVNEV